METVVSFRTQIQTVFLLVGPSGCGKTNFVKNILIPNLQSQLTGYHRTPNIQYISSDEIRQDILGNDFPKMAHEMNGASQAAFDLLKHKLKIAMSYPINAEFVILDTTGISSEFRDEVCQIVAAGQYRIDLVIFDYKSRNDYYQYLPENDETQRKVTTRHLDKFRTEFYKEMRAKNYNNIHKIKRYLNSPEELDVVIEDLEYYKTCFLDPNTDYAIISDVHGCKLEFIELLGKLGFKTLENGMIEDQNRDKPKKVILIGDIIDKGPESSEVLNIVWQNPNIFLLVEANHENYVLKHFDGKLKQESYFKGWEAYFGSILEFNENDVSKLREVFARSRIFYRHPNFVTTHAPCEDVYVGKLHTNARRKMRIITEPHREKYETEEAYVEARAELLSFLKKGVYNFPTHVFGHSITPETYRNGHKLAIDTGCSSGGRLTAVYPHPWKIHYESVPARDSFPKEKLYPFFPLANLPEFSDLEFKEKRRALWMAKEKINYVSSTMCPADKLGTELESMDAALKYFAGFGVTELHSEPKWMGSRCNFYLFEDLEKCYAVSRNGYKIKQDKTDLSLQYAYWWKELSTPETEMVMVDGELVPWSILGKDLIERSFTLTGRVLTEELQLLKKFGFPEALQKTKEKYKEIKIPTLNGLPKETALVTRNFQIDLEGEIAGAASYMDQLQKYGQDSDKPEFKPFAILKRVYKDGTEQLVDNQIESYRQAKGEKIDIIVDPSKPEDAIRAKEHFNELAYGRGFEGVVLKPAVVPPKCAPYIKVRNRDYLKIIYGYDYEVEHKYEKLLKQKGIRGKLRTSINEWNIGRELLQIPYKSLDTDNKVYLRYLAAFIIEEKSEASLDPRL